MKFDPITLDTLRQEKGYQKVLRKQQKDLESLRKRHHKEKLTVQKQHCVAIEKIIKGKKLVISLCNLFIIKNRLSNYYTTNVEINVFDPDKINKYRILLLNVKLLQQSGDFKGLYCPSCRH